MTEHGTQHMQCMEVWSGSQLTMQSVAFAGLDAWVYSKPYGGARQGGDILGVGEPKKRLSIM